MPEGDKAKKIVDRLATATTRYECIKDKENSDEITRQYKENQVILDRRTLLDSLFSENVQFPLRSNHKMHDRLVIAAEFSIRSSFCMLSALVNPYRKTGTMDIWLPVEVISNINQFLITSINPDDDRNIDRFESLGESLFRPGVATSASLTAYHKDKSKSFEPSIADILDAIVCGKFNKPRQWLATNPALLTQRGTATPPNGVVMENVTPLQAAILSYDKELFELIRDLLLSHQLAEEFERQRLEIFKRRLTTFYMYIRSEADQLDALLASGIEYDKFGRLITLEYIDKLRNRSNEYKGGVNSHDFKTIFDMLQTAQQDTARDLQSPLIEALLLMSHVEIHNASMANDGWEESEEARVKPWSALTLMEKFTRFRNTLNTSIPNAETLWQHAFNDQKRMQGTCIMDVNPRKQAYWRVVSGSVQPLLSARLCHSYADPNYKDNGLQSPRTLKLADQTLFYQPRVGLDFTVAGGTRRHTEWWWRRITEINQATTESFSNVTLALKTNVSDA